MDRLDTDKRNQFFGQRGRAGWSKTPSRIVTDRFVVLGLGGAAYRR